MSIINFTVNYDLYATANDNEFSADAGADSDLIALTGDVRFTAQLKDHRPVQAADYSPRPSGIVFREGAFTGYLDSDGRLKTAPSGTIGLRIPANDPVLELDRLIYKVDFDVRTSLGEKVRVDGGYFEAPSTDTTVNLADVLQSTGASVNGILRQSGYAEDIIDATSLGRALITAANQSAAWDVLGGWDAVGQLPIPNIDATGVASSSTFLRGDGTWTNLAATAFDEGEGIAYV